jgi:hypothetical protein
MRWTVHRLLLRREQRFDLIVSRVDSTGAARFVRALAAKCECGFGEGCTFARSVGWGRFRAHGESVVLSRAGMQTVRAFLFLGYGTRSVPATL